MTGLPLMQRLALLAFALPLPGRAEECAAGVCQRAAEGAPARGLDLLQTSSAVRGASVLLAEEAEEEEADEEGASGEGDQDDQLREDDPPHAADWDYYARYVNLSGYVPEPSNGTDDAGNGTDAQPGVNGSNGTGSPQDGSWPWPGGTVPFPIVGVPDPVPCVSYNASHPLVEKQLRGEVLSRWEVLNLIEEPTGFASEHCRPAPGTRMIKTKEHKKVCILRGWLYTVCFTERGPGRRGRDRLRCGVFTGGAPARRADGSTDCMGGCNEGSTSCGVRSHRGACFTHDLCSIVKDASGFIFHRDCGDEAHAAVRGAGTCKGPRW